ncbi:MAG: type II toxin-antitoxin system VapC family toxin [Synechococcales bacterium]|nr:type II toxin-antitoxin system VapC family toxin [Synechococcales bacterium]
MTLRILATDHISLFQRGNPGVVQRYSGFAADELAVTAISVEEQMRGWLAAIRNSENPVQLTENYERLVRSVLYFNTITIIPFDLTSYGIYDNFIAQRFRGGRQDLKIAAIALSQNAILVTRNQRDFTSIPGLQLEDWSS